MGITVNKQYRSTGHVNKSNALKNKTSTHNPAPLATEDELKLHPRFVVFVTILPTFVLESMSLGEISCNIESCLFDLKAHITNKETIQSSLPTWQSLGIILALRPHFRTIELDTYCYACLLIHIPTAN